MRIAWIVAGLIFAVVSVCLEAQLPEQEITVIGKLVRAVAIGGESTGWVLDLEAPTDIDGKQVNSIQVIYRKTAKLAKLENKRVKASGKLAPRQGVETGVQPVLDVSSIQEAKATTQAAQTP